MDNEEDTVDNKYIRLLQFLIGTDVDGDFGPRSRAAADRLLNELQQLYDNIKDMLRIKEEASDK